MRIFLIASAALLVFGGVAGMASAAQTRTALPVMQNGIEGPKANLVFSDSIDQSVAKDPTGNAPIKGGSGGFYNPRHVYQTLRELHPELGFTKANPGKQDFAAMSEYIRTLELKPLAKGGMHYNSRIIRTGNSYKLDLTWTRNLETGTMVWVDRNTGVAIFKANCANGIKLIPPKRECVIVNAEVYDPRAFSLIWARYRKEDDECFAYRRVSKLYELDASKTPWQTVPRGCIGRPCDLTAVNDRLDATQVAQGQIPIDGTGVYQIRMSPDEHLVLCEKLDHEGLVVSSFAAGVRWKQDYKLVSGEWHARVYHESDQAVADGIKLNGPKGLAFWASSTQAEAEMRGLAGMTSR